RVRHWDAAKGKQLWESSGEWDGTHGVNSIALSPDGQTLAISGKPSRQGLPSVSLYDLTTRQRRTELLDVPGWFLSMTFTPDGKHRVLGSPDGTALVWDPFLPRTKRKASEGR